MVPWGAQNCASTAMLRFSIRARVPACLSSHTSQVAPNVVARSHLPLVPLASQHAVAADVSRSCKGCPGPLHRRERAYEGIDAYHGTQLGKIARQECSPGTISQISLAQPANGPRVGRAPNCSTDSIDGRAQTSLHESAVPSVEELRPSSLTRSGNAGPSPPLPPSAGTPGRDSLQVLYKSSSCRELSRSRLAPCYDDRTPRRSA